MSTALRVAPTRKTGLMVFSIGAALLAFGTTRRSSAGKLIAAGSIPMLYWGAGGRWSRAERFLRPEDDTRRALGGNRGVRVREAVRLEVPISEVYAHWRRLENLPRFMRHLESVKQYGNRSHWVAAGPAGVHVEWDAELINEYPDQLIAWRSLPGSDVTTAGSVNFARARGGRETQVTVTLQYAAPGGKPGALMAALFGREPSQMIREDLRHFKQLLEAGEIAQGDASYEAHQR